MGLLKSLLIGAAVYGAVKYATKKGANGKSLVDELTEQAPEWLDKAKEFGNDLKQQYRATTDPYQE
ncbi:YtxH domain-containing protein [Pedobacter gandavensis]|uniref:YtxH domain-containing protein n=1 Tax=Pedobacter gandavensis TaxID=2679963 RepID=UPI00292E0123|nr:YtxH domain-containing protein [Pedobacter gandavensis]